jgi:cobalt/nickel transport system permease protein
VNRKSIGWFVVGLAVTVFIAIVVSQFASDEPDGLEYVAEQQGFGDAADAHDLAEAPLAEYGENLESDSRISTGLAGLVGVAAALGIGFGLFWLIRSPGPDSADPTR